MRLTMHESNNDQYFVAQFNTELKRWDVIAFARTADESSHIMDWESRFSGWDGEFISSKWNIERYHVDQSIIDAREQQRYDNRYPQLPKINVTIEHVHRSIEDVMGEDDESYDDAELCAAIATFASDPIFNPITVGMAAIDLVRGFDRHKTPIGKLFSEIVEWQRETFPNASTIGAARHLLEEAHELVAAVESDEFGLAEEEAADVLLLLLSVCDKIGANLLEAARTKLDKNRQRTWHATPDGYFKHDTENDHDHADQD